MRAEKRAKVRGHDMWYCFSTTGCTACQEEQPTLCFLIKVSRCINSLQKLKKSNGCRTSSALQILVLIIANNELKATNGAEKEDIMPEQLALYHPKFLPFICACQKYLSFLIYL